MLPDSTVALPIVLPPGIGLVQGLYLQASIAGRYIGTVCAISVPFVDN